MTYPEDSEVVRSGVVGPFSRRLYDIFRMNETAYRLSNKMRLGMVTGILKGDSGTPGVPAVCSVASDPQNNINLLTLGKNRGTPGLDDIVSTQIYGGIVFFDDFEGGLAWSKQDVAGVGAVASENTLAFRGGKCLKVTTGGAANNETYGYKRFAGGIRLANTLYLIGKFYSTDANVKYLIIDLIYYDGVNRWNFAVKLDPINNKIQYFNSAGAWTDLPEASTYVLSAIWNEFVIAADIKNKVWKYLQINNTQYPLLNVATNTAADATYMKGSMYYSFGAATNAAAAVSVWLDDALVVSES